MVVLTRYRARRLLEHGKAYSLYRLSYDEPMEYDNWQRRSPLRSGDLNSFDQISFSDSSGSSDYSPSISEDEMFYTNDAEEGDSEAEQLYPAIPFRTRVRDCLLAILFTWLCLSIYDSMPQLPSNRLTQFTRPSFAPELTLPHLSFSKVVVRINGVLSRDLSQFSGVSTRSSSKSQQYSEFSSESQLADNAIRTEPAVKRRKFSSCGYDRSDFWWHVFPDEEKFFFSNPEPSMSTGKDSAAKSGSNQAPILNKVMYQLPLMGKNQRKERIVDRLAHMRRIWHLSNTHITGLPRDLHKGIWEKISSMASRVGWTNADEHEVVRRETALNGEAPKILLPLEKCGWEALDFWWVNMPEKQLSQLDPADVDIVEDARSWERKMRQTLFEAPEGSSAEYYAQLLRNNNEKKAVDRRERMVRWSKLWHVDRCPGVTGLSQGQCEDINRKINDFFGDVGRFFEIRENTMHRSVNEDN